MKLQCSLCSNVSTLQPHLLFHRLPGVAVDRAKWIKIVEEFRGQPMKESLIRICNVHFKLSDYRHAAKPKILKSGAIPVVNQNDDKDTDNSVNVTPPSTPRRTGSTPVRVLGQTTPLRKNAKQPYWNFTAQRIKNEPARLRAYTGLQCKEIFESLFQFFTPAVRKLPLVNTKRTVLKPNPSTPRRKQGQRSVLPREDQFLMTLMRLRKNIQEDVLGDMFQVSTSTVSRILNTWILILAQMIEHTPIWPTKEEVQDKMPEAYNAFPNLRVIIDCTEMEIETPSSLIVQKGSFSNYKQRNTVKALIGITPYGQISFVSMLYEGSTSDKKIFNHCGIVGMLQPGDAVMADRGFITAEECQQIGVTLITPDFLSGAFQFSPEQVKNTRSIASLRVLVENKIGDIKKFQILHNRIPLSTAAIISPIFTVCSYLSNFTVKPGISSADIEENNEQANVEGQVLAPVILPSDLIDVFLDVAKPNTDNNTETLGFLLGEKVEEAFRITTLFLPKQSGTPHSCVCNDDISVQLCCDQNQLVIIGWIHTHPRHSCFMSSVDLHTHYSYQMLMKESIAIVCSPIENRNEAFTIDPGVGLSTLASCNLHGFHVHDDAENLFRVAEHVSTDQYTKVITIDYR